MMALMDIYGFSYIKNVDKSECDKGWKQRMVVTKKNQEVRQGMGDCHEIPVCYETIQIFLSNYYTFYAPLGTLRLN